MVIIVSRQYKYARFHRPKALIFVVVNTPVKVGINDVSVSDSGSCVGFNEAGCEKCGRGWVELGERRCEVESDD
jgi:hypothetical protein